MSQDRELPLERIHDRADSYLDRTLLIDELEETAIAVRARRAGFATEPVQIAERLEAAAARLRREARQDGREDAARDGWNVEPMLDPG
jgi:hypothetical protein